MAIRETVTQYSQPLPRGLKRPFSETHISQNIKAQRLWSMTKATKDEGVTSEDEKSTSDFFSPVSTVSPEFCSAEESGTEQTGIGQAVDDTTYKPTQPATEIAYEKLKSRVLELLSQEHMQSQDPNLTELTSHALLHYLKDSTLSLDQKQQAVNALFNAKLPEKDLQDLEELSAQLMDFDFNEYDNPLDSNFTSETATLNAAMDPVSQPAGPPVYPDPEQITEDLLTQRTYTGANLPPLELLVRTSGVERLSDFMLWQCHQDTEIAFVKCYWPEFGLKHLFPIILEWQRRKKQEAYWSEARSSWTKRS